MKMLTDKELDFILSQPEGQFVEFKKSISSDLAREVVAFANSSGGKIILGVDDHGSIIGVSNVNGSLSKLESSSRNCDPPILIRSKIVKRSKATIIAVDIPEGSDKPYSCSNGFFLRNGATSQKMKRNEIIDYLFAYGQVKYEDILCREFTYPDDFDEKAFLSFLRMSDLTTENISTVDLLLNLGLAHMDGSEIAFRNSGVLFFAKEPTRFFIHAVVDCILFNGTERIEILDRKEQKGGLLENVKQAMAFLKQHLSLRYEIKDLIRKEIPEIPYDALREAVLNAVIHRDYHFDNANISIEIYRDRVEISDPGNLPPGLKPEDLGKKSIRRNRILADMFHRMGEVEKVGTGIGRIRNALINAGLSEPKFSFGSFFVIKFERPGYKAMEVTTQDRALERLGDRLGDRLGERLGENQIKMLSLILDNKNITINDMSNMLEISTTGVEKHISKLKKLGLIHRIGSAKGGHWEVVEDE
jgi:ATP-dependent DNA helicase RecG